MTRVCAVIAHFASVDACDAAFVNLVNVTASTVDSVVVVSTSPITNSELFASGVSLVVRPNIGYDFFSYKAGLDVLRKDLGPSDVVIFTNSSIVITDNARFSQAIGTAIAKTVAGRVVSFTHSVEIAPHMQSYFISSQYSALCDGPIFDFFEKLRPQASKFAVILAQEIGISAAVRDANLHVLSLFTPAFSDWLYFVKGETRLQTSSNIRGYASRLMQIVKGVNPVQEFANSISAQLGFVKRELILRNPQNIKLRQKTVFGVEGIAPPTTEVVWSFTRGGQNAGVLPIAVLLHAHHPEVISEILNAVDNVSEQFHLIVTSSRDDAFDEVLKNLPLNANRVTLVRCENIGRDVKPFLEVLKLGLIDGSEAVLKIHTKRTIGMSYGDGWRSALLQQLIPEANLLKQVISSIRSGKFGLVGPRNDYLTDGDKYWGNNAQNVSRIRKTLEIQLPDSQLRFFAGTMFWFSPRALSGVNRLLEEFVFDQELGQMDGTIAHAIERSIIDIAEHNGFRIGTVSVRLDDLPADGNDEQWFPGSIEL